MPRPKARPAAERAPAATVAPQPPPGADPTPPQPGLEPESIGASSPKSMSIVSTRPEPPLFGVSPIESLRRALAQAAASETTSTSPDGGGGGGSH